MHPPGDSPEADAEEAMPLAKANQRANNGAESMPLVMSRDLEAGTSDQMQCRICLESDNCECLMSFPSFVRSWWLRGTAP
jgi:hypothetical protein